MQYKLINAFSYSHLTTLLCFCSQGSLIGQDSIDKSSLYAVSPRTAKLLRAKCKSEDVRDKPKPAIMLLKDLFRSGFCFTFFSITLKTKEWLLYAHTHRSILGAADPIIMTPAANQYS
jgi:hypothetical protein